ncbi:MAG: formyltransferase family protein [Thaumarchaeota archaeon]|nr:formyltransferase family protein [Nitrososphaerota archaeon]
MAKATVGISIVGRDREGVVAAFTSYAFRNGANIEKISQNVIRGLFGMHLEVSFAKAPDRKEFDAGLQSLARSFGMEVSAHHEDGSTKQIAVFVTRGPHCLDAILAARASLRGGSVAVVVGTEGTLRGACRRARVPFVAVEERNQEAAEERLLSTCKRREIDVIVLARYMRILTPNFVWRYPNRIINVHPSLLPAFPGASAYAQAHERGTKIAGVTTHYVTESLDQGPIIAQRSFEVRAGDSLETIRSRGQRLEARALLESLRLHLAGRLDVRWRKVHAGRAARGR